MNNLYIKITLLSVAIFSSLLCAIQVWAAAPVTHAVLAEKWIAMHENYNDEQKRSFILGTLFPDIRYLGIVTRNQTHEKGITLQKLLETQSEFNKGKRLHAFVDKARENLVVKWKIYHRLKNVPGHRKATFLKLVEDEILFNRKDWNEIRRFLSFLHPEEKAFGIKDEHLRKWHTNQLRAFRAPPSLYLKYLAMFGMGFAHVSPEITGIWSKLLPEYAKDPAMQEYVDNLLKEFDKIYALN